MLLEEIFDKAIEKKASDVHLNAEQKVVFRINGVLSFQKDWPIVKPGEVEQIAEKVLTDYLKEQLKEKKEVDFSYQTKSGRRFRVNFYQEKGNLALSARFIWPKIPTLEDIDAQPVIYDLLKSKQGLILVTGPAGCGKSTTLAASIDWLNKHYAYHIITLEDPIEFLFKSEKSLISQRELGRDFISFGQALRHVVRQDPNVIMVGEMRDLETISLAVTLAETGHLILATLHTPNAMQTIDRIVDVFPSAQQTQIRLQLSLSLKAVISQWLVPRIDGGRIAAREIMVNNSAIATMIRENKISNIINVIQTGSKFGMQTMDQDLENLYKHKKISLETAKAFARYPEAIG